MRSGKKRPADKPIPRPAALQRLFPVQSIVTFKTGSVSRGEILRNASGLAGARWYVPAPDPSLGTLIWASLSFDWAFYNWQSWEPQNTGDSSFRLKGSIDWAWYLVSNTDFVSQDYTFLQDEGSYSFYMDFAPGDAGFSVGWLTPPRSSTYPDDPRDKRFGPRTPLQALLTTNVNGALRLWFENAYWNQVPGAAYTIGGGPETLYYLYAYASPAARLANEARA